MCGGGLGADVPKALSFLVRCLEGLAQAPEDIRGVLGCGELAGMDSLGMERIGQHGFLCVLRHPSPRWPDPTVFRQLPAGPVEQARQGRLRPGLLLQLPQLPVGPALTPQSVGGSVALGVGVGMDARGGLVRTGGDSGPGGVLIVLCAGGVWGIRGAWAYADTWTRGYGLCLGVGRGSVAVLGH